MPFKVNKKAIENYSHTLMEKIVYLSFYKKSFITGAEINTLTDSAQINVLILKTIFEKWNDEMERLKSPLFDFENSEVQEAFNIFKNKLSYNIKIDQKNFEPILEKAVKDTFSLAFEPEDTVIELFLSDIETYKEKLKFLKLHPDLAKKLASIQHPTIEELIDIVKNWPKYELNATELLVQTSKIHIGSIDDFLLEEPIETIAPIIKIVPLISDEKNTVNDTFLGKTHEVNNLAKQFQEKKKIQSLHTGININQRFVFIKELFGGNSEVYNQVIERLDVATSLDAADSIIKEEAYSKFDWENKEDKAIEFMEILSRKF